MTDGVYDTFIWSIMRKFNNVTRYDWNALGDYKTGSPDGNGTYSGLIGMVQSGELDTVALSFNPAHLPYEPVAVGPAVVPSDQTLVSVSKKAKPQPVEIIDWFKIPDPITYEFVGFLFLISIVLLTIFHYYDQPFAKLKKRRVTWTFCHNAFNCYTLTIDQEGFSPTNGPQQVLTAALALFMFFMIEAIFKNLLSTDKTIEKLVPQIDTIQDLLENPKFSEYIPVVFEGFWHIDGLKTASPETDEGKLWAKMMQTKNESVIKWGKSEAQMREFSKISTDLLFKFLDRKRVMIFDRELTSRIKQALCRIPKYLLTESLNFSSLELIHIATQTFSAGSLHIPLSHKLPQGVKKYLDYRYRTAFEFGLLKPKLALYANEQFPEFTQIPSPHKGYECAASRPDPFGDPQPMTLKDFRMVIRYFAAFLLTAFLLLILELLHPRVIKMIDDLRMFYKIKRPKRFKSRGKCIQKEAEQPIELMIRRLESTNQELVMTQLDQDSEGRVAYFASEAIKVVEEPVLRSVLNRKHIQSHSIKRKNRELVSRPSGQSSLTVLFRAEINMSESEKNDIKKQKDSSNDGFSKERARRSKLDKIAIQLEQEPERMFIRTNKMPFDVRNPPDSPMTQIIAQHTY